MRVLTVILGAGASFDSWGGKPAPFNLGWRPPLAAQLFGYAEHEARLAWWDVLRRYPGAAVIGQDIYQRMTAGDAESLEALLQEYAEDARPVFRRQFLEVPLYLRDLLMACEANHLGTPPTPGSYVRLVRGAVGADFDHVVFLTLNYDTLLETAIEMVSPDWVYWDFDHYVARDDGAPTLLKLHGSTNWGIRFGSAKPTWIGGSDEQRAHWRAEFRDFDPLSSSAMPMIGLSTEPSDCWFDGETRRPLYPLVTAPLSRKSRNDIVCPAQVIERAMPLLKETQNLIIIGTGGLDDDLHQLLTEAQVEPLAVTVVSESKAQAARTWERFTDARSSLAEAHISSFTEGFRNYAASDALKQSMRRMDWH